MKTAIVIPVKDFRHAKQRLEGALGPRSRHALAIRLYRRTLSFFTEHFAGHHLMVVTASDTAARIARRQGVAVLKEEGEGGLCAATEQAAAWATREGFDSLLFIPTDIGYLDVAELQHLLSAPRSTPSVLICPAVDAGTNALLTTPPNAIPFSFGYCSSEKHRLAAISRGISYTLLPLPHLRFDIDTSADLHHLASRHGTEFMQEMAI